MNSKLYSATYSGVPVYEYIHPKSSVMRRKADGWVNATHILKVANFPKAKRTRILERQVQTGVHQKVQGGYGKYQGTWVPLESAVGIAKQFGVYNEIRPLLEYKSTPGTATPPPAPKHHHASTRKKLGRPPRVSRRSTRTRTNNNNNNRANKQGERILKSRPGRKAGKAGRKRGGSQLSGIQRVPGPVSPAISVKRAYSSIRGDHGGRISTSDKRRMLRAPGGSSMKLEGSDSPISSDISSDSDSLALSSDGSSGEDFLASAAQNAVESSNNNNNTPQTASSIADSPGSSTSVTPMSRKQQLLQYFLDSGTHPVPKFVTKGNWDVDGAIDREGNTTLHWACAMGDLRMCEALLNGGSDGRALNDRGEVPAMRCVIYTNSYARRTFAKILDLLRGTLLDADSRGRTILHHIALSTACHASLPAAPYYTEILLTKVAETARPTELFINFLNQQDDQGNTALHIFSYNNARKCARILLAYNARIDIPNACNEYVSDYMWNGGSINGNPGAGITGGLPSITTSIGSTGSLGTMKVFSPSFSSQKALLGKPEPLATVTPTKPHSHRTPTPSTQPGLQPSPMQLTGLPSISKLPSGLFNSSVLTIPHYSEAAMEVSQRSGEIVDKLCQLATSFDTEVQQKDSDAKELRVLLVQMDREISETGKNTQKMLTEVNGKGANEGTSVSDPIKLASNELQSLKDECQAKTAKLRQLIERSHIGDSKAGTDDKITNGESEQNSNKPVSISEGIALALKLIKTRMAWKEAADELFGVYTDTSGSTALIDKYRRLVSKLSNVPLTEVDSSLRDIEECLKGEKE